MTDTKIEWTDKVWNPTTGCDRVSPGCDHCYAMTLAKRLKGMRAAKYQTDGDPRTSGPGFGVAVHPTALDAPLRWTKPSRVFVNSMSDLFHDEIPDDFIAQVFGVMAAAPRHTFQVLTKRHGRMRSLLNRPAFRAEVTQRAAGHTTGRGPEQAYHGAHRDQPWPLSNVWLGVSVENQQWANIRIPALLDTPATVRFLSCEPLLGPVDLALQQYHHDGALPYWRASYLHWVIVGGESGPGARPMDLDWARDLRDQCTAVGVSYFYKQQGSGDGGPKSRRELDGRTWDEYPAVVA